MLLYAEDFVVDISAALAHKIALRMQADAAHLL
jgi:hypothetical protein